MNRMNCFCWSFLLILLFWNSSLNSYDEMPFDPILSEEKMVFKANQTTPSSWLISFHQQVISLADGPRSHFYPTSSDYMQQSLSRCGIFGYFLGMDRLLRENEDPWLYPRVRIGNSVRKYDPVPSY